MTRGRPSYGQVVAELELVRGERDEARAALKKLRTEHTNACGFWVRRDAEQKATIARLRGTESGAA